MSQLDEYDISINYGKENISVEYDKLKIRLIFDIKYDGRHNVRCVLVEHLVGIPEDSLYSGVVSICGLRTILLLAEINQLNTWVIDMYNVYIDSKTSE